MIQLVLVDHNAGYCSFINARFNFKIDIVGSYGVLASK